MSDAAELPVADVSNSPVPVPPPTGPPGWAKFLYNHNPFYLISTAFVLMGIRLAYGNVAIGELNCWLMMLTLTGYTLLVAGTGILIVRWGQVWDDARSIMLALCLLFVAISVSTDELLLIEPQAAVGLILYGYLLAAGVSQAVISGTGMRMPLGYLLPFHAMLLLLHTYAYFCSPEARDLTRSQLDWRIFLFPQCFAVLLLSLWPAVRRGAEYVADNRTPWSWPLYPGSLFAILTFIAGFRAYILSLSFGPSRESDYAVVFGAYFLIPCLLVTAVLVYEGARAAQRSQIMSGVLWGLPLLLLLAAPTGTSGDYRRFFDEFSSHFGTPLWLTAWMLLASYAGAWIRGHRGAYAGILASTMLISTMTAATRQLNELSLPSPTGLIIVAGLMLFPGWREQNSRWLFGAVCCFACATFVGSETLIAQQWALPLTAHVFLLGVLLLALLFTDPFARALAVLGAGMLLFLSVSTIVNGLPTPVPHWGSVLYFGGAAALAWICWGICRHPAFLVALCAHAALILLGLSVRSYLLGTSLIGRPAMFSLSWGSAFFGIGLLISMLKAGRLRFAKRWYSQTAQAAGQALDV